MEKKEEKKKEVVKEPPLATLVIREYKDINTQLNETNKRLQNTNKRTTIIALILLVLVAIETTYIILYWEMQHPESGVIREESND